MLTFIQSIIPLVALPGGSEWILIAIVVLLMFGGKKIPELMKGLGRGVREFKDARGNDKTEIEEGVKEKEKEAKDPVPPALP